MYESEKWPCNCFAMHRASEGRHVENNEWDIHQQYLQRLQHKCASRSWKYTQRIIVRVRSQIYLKFQCRGKTRDLACRRSEASEWALHGASAYWGFGTWTVAEWNTSTFAKWVTNKYKACVIRHSLVRYIWELYTLSALLDLFFW